VNTGRADPSGGAGDQGALAHAELALAEQGVEGGREDLGKASGLGPGQAVGHGQGMGLVDHGQ
jgi:hypothetical protein